jgi:broad specificity phosphatase PhoE
VARRHLYLIRHGQYDTSARGKNSGKLTNLGREQAWLTGQMLKHLPITAIYASTMTRASETARIIAAAFEGVKVQRTHVLRECVPTVPPLFSDYFVRLAERDPDFTPELVERHRQQANKAFARYFKPLRDDADRYEVLVAHGNILAYLVCRALGVSPDAWGNVRMFHCGVTRITVEANGIMFLFSHNDIGHLPLSMRTEM